MLLWYFYLLLYFYYKILQQTRSKSGTHFKATQMLSSMPEGDKFKPKKVTFEASYCGGVMPEWGYINYL